MLCPWHSMQSLRPAARKTRTYVMIFVFAPPAGIIAAILILCVCACVGVVVAREASSSGTTCLVALKAKLDGIRPKSAEAGALDVQTLRMQSSVHEKGRENPTRTSIIYIYICVLGSPARSQASLALLKAHVWHAAQRHHVH